MTPERWKQIEQLYHAALKLEPGQQSAFLQGACAGDEDLRREVESLLAHEPQGESFIEVSAIEGTAQAMAEKQGQPLVGRQLGVYKILSLLGAGGMGEVYKAQDTRLNRIVAIKVLPRHLSERVDLRQRFEQEARALASLSHPHICPIHVIGKEDGIEFLVMEYVAGKTLDELIPRKGLRSTEVLKYAIQIADALATAHAAGIVHRDLKPGNIMVSESGQVKVLDFGLAKHTGGTRAPARVLSSNLESEDSSAASVRGSARSTQSEGLTEEGTVLGTVSYMSPEQAEGKNLDARSDIFSFGLVLYEMVTGQRAFTGQSDLATLSAILREEPKPARQIVGDIPPDLDKIIKRCLRKDRERRSQNMADVKIALQELKEESDSGTLVQVASTKGARRRGRVWTAVAVVALAVAGVAVWISRSTTKVPEAPLTAVPLTSYPGEERQPAFSPDGNQVAFSWNGEMQNNFDIYVKLIGPGTQLRLTSASEADTCPAWSPDGSSIAFIREELTGKASVFLISPLGPPERKVAEIGETGIGWGKLDWAGVGGLAWAPDGKSLVVTDRSSDSEPLGLYLLSVESGEKRRLTSPPDKRLVDNEPAFSPDGRTLAFTREVGVGARDIYLLTLSEDFQPIGEPKRLTFENLLIFRPVWTSDGREIIFSYGPYRSPNLFRIAASGSVKPQRLAGVGEDGSGSVICRRNHRLVYTRELVDVNIWRLEVPGPHGKMSAPMKLISSTRVDGDPQFSPDGKKIAFNSNRTGSSEIWICDSDGSHAQQLTSRGGPGDYSGGPCWSPDGEQIAFSSMMEGQWRVYVTSINRGKPRRLTNSSASDSRPSWSFDGKWIYFISNRTGEDQVWKMPAGGGKEVQLTQKGGFEALEFPDGKWVYYAKWLAPGGLWKVPKDGGEETQVLESVKVIDFAFVNGGIYFIPVPDSAGRHSIQFFNFATKTIRLIATLESPADWGMAVSPDGRWILYSQIDQMGSDLMLVENFH